MKTIVVGPSLSGKTTIIRELRKSSTIPVSEMDEMLTEENNGEYPTDNHFKNTFLAPKVIAEILSKDEILFFTNTDYLSMEDLRLAKEKGFKIIVLDIAQEELLKRNNVRVANEGYEDQSQWFDGMLKYQQQLKESGLVDLVIDSTLPTSQIVSELQNQ